MAPEPPADCPRGPHWLLRPGDQAAVALLVFGWVAATIGWCVVRGAGQASLVELDDAEPRAAVFWVDVNRAEWPELSQLPRIGPTLAGRIIESRQTEGPLRSPDDLLRVRGIGPKTLDGLRRYLRPLGDGEEGAGGPAAADSR